MSEEPTTWAFICNCHWKRMVSRVWTQSNTFFATPMRCHFLRNQQKGVQRARSITYSLWCMGSRLYYSLTQPPSPQPTGKQHGDAVCSSVGPALEAITNTK